jgi:transposase-like protein
MNTELQNKARNLYFQTDLSKTDIANALGIPRRTLHYWVREQNWDYQKQCAAHMPVVIAENCYHILANYTSLLMAPERKDVMITTDEVTIISKLTAAIGRLKARASLNEQMQVLAGFVDSVNGANPEMAQALSPFISGYIEKGAAASVALSAPPPTPAERSAEQQLDLRYDEEDAIAPPTTPRPSVTIAGRHTRAVCSRQSPPPYHEFLAGLRSQDDNIRHMFPVNTRYNHPRAA